MLVDLVRVTTRDGMRLDGALRLPESGVMPRFGVDVALFLHGVGSNFYTSGTLEGIAPRLLAAGVALLPVNTRGHDNIFAASANFGRRLQGAAYEVVDESRHDVNAWLELLRERGFRRVLLVGHSLGAIKAVYTQAHEPHPLVAGVLAMSPPRLSHRAFLQSRDSGVYFAALSQAEQLVAEGRGDELFLAKFPFPLMITGAGYIDKYGPGERYNITRFVHQLRVPALFTYGSKEVAEGGGPFAGVPETLQKVKCETSTLDVGVVSGGDHFYVGVFDGLAEEIEDWLQQRLRK